MTEATLGEIRAYVAHHYPTAAAEIPVTAAQRAGEAGVCAWPLKASKTVRENPIEIAKAIARELDLRVISPGFLAEKEEQTEEIISPDRDID